MSHYISKARYKSFTYFYKYSLKKISQKFVNKEYCLQIHDNYY